MAKSPKQKQKLLYLQKILLEKTDDKHFLCVKELLDELRRYGIEAERKSIYDDIEQLSDFGMDILVRRGKGGGYALGSRAFELPELKLLVDAIQSSRFITQRKSAELIAKIEALGSTHQARSLHRQVYVTGRIKTMNESIYYNIDALHNAIAVGRQITFRYFEWQVDFDAPAKMIKRYRHDGELYQVSPWALSWDEENYYLIAFDKTIGQIRHYRVDKMERIEITDLGRDGQEQFEKFDMAVYSRKTFGMFGGEEELVTLKCQNRFAGVIRDRFGTDLMLRPCDEAHFFVNVAVQISPQFFAWVFGLTGGAEIVFPESAAFQYREQLRKACNSLK